MSETVTISPAHILRMGPEPQRERIVIPTTPHVASDNTAILEAQARQLEQARRWFDDAVAAFLAHDPVQTHEDNLIAAARGLRNARIADMCRRMREHEPTDADMTRAMR